MTDRYLQAIEIMENLLRQNRGAIRANESMPRTPDQRIRKPGFLTRREHSALYLLLTEARRSHGP